MRARTAFLVISLAPCGAHRVDADLVGRRPALAGEVLADLVWTCRRWCADLDPQRRRGAESDWILASSRLMPLPSSTSRAVVDGRRRSTGTSQATPPSKSMPRFRPADEQRQQRSRITTPEMTNPIVARADEVDTSSRRGTAGARCCALGRRAAA